MTLRSTAAGQAAAFLTGEMSTARVMERALAIEGRVRVDDLRRGGLDDVAHSGVAAAALALRRRPPMFEDLRDAGVDGVSDFLAQNLGIDLTVVDPIQALTRGDRPVDEELADIARRLKELALRRSTVILAVSGLREAVAGRPDQRPSLRDLGRTWCAASPCRRRPRALSRRAVRAKSTHRGRDRIGRPEEQKWANGASRSVLLQAVAAFRGHGGTKMRWRRCGCRMSDDARCSRSRACWRCCWRVCAGDHTASGANSDACSDSASDRTGARARAHRARGNDRRRRREAVVPHRRGAAPTR